jgi:type II secretory ATPase GspE/PulE/Tfp pilus assembly ATPase PilB-like protein
VLRRALAEPNGIVLVTGPTGSGKTTTLYAALRQLNDGARNILTVEDPVEYAVDGVGQTQVNARVGLTFAAGLRAILRQDPDVVMVGEIRDRETADIAVQASLTGHLVLSTVHTNDAAGAITRMRDMGVEPFLLASTLRAVIAQRLVRRLCPHCREPHESDPALHALIGVKPGRTVYLARGCAECAQTGYVGRIGVFEALRVDETIRRMIHDNADEAEIAARLCGFAASGQGGAPSGARWRDQPRRSGADHAARGRVMPRFTYLAIDPKGHERRGAIEAAGERQALEAGRAILARGADRAGRRGIGPPRGDFHQRHRPVRAAPRPSNWRCSPARSPR